MTLKRQILRDAAAFAYLRDVLSQGRRLSNRLLDLDLEKGTIWTYLRPDVSLDYAQNHLNETWLIVADEEVEPAIVTDSYRIRQKPTSIESLFIDFIQQFLQRSPYAYCVLEDASIDSGAPFLQKRQHEPFAFYAGDVLYALRHGTATPDAISQGLRSTHGWVQTGILACLPADADEIDPWTEITDQQMAMLVSGVHAILVSAFDGVGYLVWERD